MHHNGRMLGVIGGSGFYSFFEDASASKPRDIGIDTPYGQPSAPITVGAIGQHEVAFLPRHGAKHEYSAHTVPYRANMWALRKLGVRRVLAPCAVGSLNPEYGPGAVVVPDQLVDRTNGRADTYFDSGAIHVDFADPYCPTLRTAVTGLPGVVDGGTMVVIQGPRFSTRAESQWFASAGFSLVNMTGYPEAVLARELEICYAAIALVTDLDAGIAAGEGVKAVDVFAEFERNMGLFKQLVREAIGRVAVDRQCTHCLAHTGVTLPFELP
jgi:5'-methylthioadenosine phosphorylase